MDIERMAGRIAQGVVGEMLSDTEALDHITGLLGGREWDEDMLSQVAQFVRETGRDVSRPEAGIGDDPGYDPDEGEWGDYDEDDGDLLASICDEVLDHVAASMLRVDRADDCVWLVDERGAAPQNIHMTPDQATEAGEALVEAGAGTGESLTLQIGASRAATRNGYFLGEMFIPDLRVNPRYQDYPGSIEIGGDHGDVWATSAYGDERDGLEGVVLVDVEFKTGLDLDDLDRDELLSEAEQVVQESYASIQEETFIPSKRNVR